MNKFDLQNDNYNYLADLVRGHARVELMDIAMQKDVFSLIGDGKQAEEMPALLGFDQVTTEAFLGALAKLGLVGVNGGYVFNTPVSAQYLDHASGLWSGDTLVANTMPQKFLAKEMAPYFTGVDFSLPVKVTAFDDDGAVFAASLWLSHDEVKLEESDVYSLVVAGKDFAQVCQDVAEEGYLVVLGEFADLDSEGAAINRLRRCFNHREAPLPSSVEVRKSLTELGFVSTMMMPISDTAAAIYAARSQEILDKLTIDPLARLSAELMQTCNIRSLKPMDPNEVILARWVADHCRFGCSTYGEKCCPPNSPSWDQTKERLSEYKKALLIEGEPPTGEFQKMMLKVEKTAFKAGYYKAFVLWSGPCSICTECKPPAPPKKCTATRPSMESSGIDVFATVRNQGYQLRTLKDKTEFVKYFGLLVLE